MRSVLLLLLFALSCTGETNTKAFNYNPTVRLFNPMPDEVLSAGDWIDFEAEVDDANHDSSRLLVSWWVDGDLVCDWAEPTDGKVSLCSIQLEPEMSTVLVVVRDPQGAGASDQMPLTVSYGPMHEVTIMTPADGDWLYGDQLVSLNGLVAADDLNEISVDWKSDIDGVLAHDLSLNASGETSLSVSLSPGMHRIELSAIDTDGRRSIDSGLLTIGPPNSAPDCGVTSPTDGSVFAYGFALEVSGFVFDQDIPSSEIIVSWSSDQDGFLSDGFPDAQGRLNEPLIGLSPGLHLITLTASDEMGLTCISEVFVQIGRPPTVYITNPFFSDVYNLGESVLVTAAISSPDYTAESHSVSWWADGLSATPIVAESQVDFIVDGLNAGWQSIFIEAIDPNGLISTDSVTVLVNTPPLAPEVELQPVLPNSGQDLHAVVLDAFDEDGDQLNLTYSWFKNGLLQSYVGASIPSSDTEKGDQWRVEVQSSDGFSQSPIGFADAVIQNTPPVLTSVAITPSNGVHNDQTLTCLATAIDPDETPNITYEWRLSSTGVFIGFGSTLTLDPTDVHPFDSIQCVATATDLDGAFMTSQATVFVENRAPTLGGLLIDPPSPRTDSVLTCSVFEQDADLDPLNVFYAWQDMGSGAVLHVGQEWRLTPANIDPGDTIRCTATAIDPYGALSQLYGDALVENRDPKIDYVSISPSTGVPNNGTLSCYAQGVDPDMHPINVFYTWTNLHSGQNLGNGQSLNLSPSTGVVGDVIQCDAVVTDSHGASVNGSAQTTVLNSPPVLTGPIISPAVGVYTSELLTCSASGVDSDGDPLSISYLWRNASDGAILGSADTLQLSPFLVRPLDVLVCEATLTDGRGGVVGGAVNIEVLNTEPVATVSEISPTFIRVGDVIDATGAAIDADLDTVSYRFDWYIDNVLQNHHDVSIGPGVPKNTKVQVAVHPFDGMTYGAALASNVIYVQNSPPGGTTIELEPQHPVENEDDLLCRIAQHATDPDGDVIDYEITWYVDGALWQGPTDSVHISGDSISANLIEGWQIWECMATPNDGSSMGPTSGSNEVEVRIQCDPSLSPNLSFNGLDFSCIPGQTFHMGSQSSEEGRDTDEDYHPVGLSQSFFISTYEVTQHHFVSSMGYNPSQWTNCGMDCPVENLSWHEAAQYANAVSDENGLPKCYSCTGSGPQSYCDAIMSPYDCLGYRLPTEAEWELAARAGTSSAFWTPNGGGDIQIGESQFCYNSLGLTDGTQLIDYMWFCPNRPTGSSSRTSPVGLLEHNGFGLYDMHGNVMEWVGDWYVDHLGGMGELDPQGPPTGAQKVVRGGYWLSVPADLRVAARTSFEDELGFLNIGFRLARSFPY